MIQILCSDCRKPIDPQVDNFIDCPSLRIQVFPNVMSARDLHFCDVSHFISWLKKNGEPSHIISSINQKGPAL